MCLLSHRSKALTHDRPYQRARTRDEAAREMRREAGLTLDPVLVAAVLTLVGEGDGEDPA